MAQARISSLAGPHSILRPWLPVESSATGYGACAHDHQARRRDARRLIPGPDCDAVRRGVSWTVPSRGRPLVVRARGLPLHSVVSPAPLKGMWFHRRARRAARVERQHPRDRWGSSTARRRVGRARTGLLVDLEIPSGNAKVMPCGSTVHDPSRIHTGIVRPPGHCPSPICSPSTLRLTDGATTEACPRRACSMGFRATEQAGSGDRLASAVDEGCSRHRTNSSIAPFPREVCCLDEQFLVADMKE